jgi:hypothetical protein
VRANPASFERYIDDMVALCEQRGVAFRYGVDVVRTPDALAGFDRIVIASGARYRAGLGSLVTALLEAGVARWPGLRAIPRNEKVRDWFYHRARRATGAALRQLARPEQKVVVIGDAMQAGKSRPAIASAFQAALLG